MSELIYEYWDASVWLAYFDPGNDESEDRKRVAKELIQNLTGTHRVVISDLILMEIIGVIRERVIESQPFSGINFAKKEQLKTDSKKQVNNALIFLRDLAKSDKAIFFHSNQSVIDLQKKTLNILNNYIYGDIIPRRKKCICPTCGEVKSPTKYKLKYPAHYDIQHVLFATEPLPEGYVIKKIVAFDKAFSQLQNLKEFNNIIEIDIPF